MVLPVAAVIFLPAVPADRNALAIAGEVDASTTAIKSPTENGWVSLISPRFVPSV